MADVEPKSYKVHSGICRKLRTSNSISASLDAYLGSYTARLSSIGLIANLDNYLDIYTKFFSHKKWIYCYM